MVFSHSTQSSNKSCHTGHSLQGAHIRLEKQIKHGKAGPLPHACWSKQHVASTACGMFRDQIRISVLKCRSNMEKQDRSHISVF
jgi:hypothetical protein